MIISSRASTLWAGTPRARSTAASSGALICSPSPLIDVQPALRQLAEHGQAAAKAAEVTQPLVDLGEHALALGDVGNKVLGHGFVLGA